MIKIISGHSHYGGSTTAHINMCNEFNSNSIPCEFYGPHEWHTTKCNGKSIKDLTINKNDIIICHYISIPTRPFCEKLIYSVHEYSNICDIKRFNINIFDGIHFVSERVKNQQISHENNKFKIIPNFVDNLKPSIKQHKVAGIIGTIDNNKQTHISIIRAIDAGFTDIRLFGSVSDNVYYTNNILPLLQKYNFIKIIGYIEDKQAMYDSISDVYHSSLSETWGYIKAECLLTNVEYHGNNQTDNTEYLENSIILNKWKEFIGL